MVYRTTSFVDLLLTQMCFRILNFALKEVHPVQLDGSAGYKIGISLPDNPYEYKHPHGCCHVIFKRWLGQNSLRNLDDIGTTFSALTWCNYAGRRRKKSCHCSQFVCSAGEVIRMLFTSFLELTSRCNWNFNVPENREIQKRECTV